MFDVRPTENLEDFQRAFLAIGQYFGAEPTPERGEKFSQSLPFERMHAAREDGAIVGGAGVFPFEMSIPGGIVRCAGVTVVGVYPTHRRRGVLRAMMRAQLDDVHERGEPIAALWASEETIYGRFGYGLAAWCGEVKLAREWGAFAQPLERRGRVRLVEPDAAAELFPPVWEALMGGRPGVFRRSPDWWQLRTLRRPDEQAANPKRFAALELGGSVQAFAVYRQHPAWDEGSTAARLEVLEAVGASPQATAEIWRYLLDIDWYATLEAQLLPPDHPLFTLLATPRRLRFRLGDSLWVRLVDVGAALSGRSYAAAAPLVFDVRDAFCPWNEGRWRLEGGEASRTNDAADLALDVADLGSVYLGGFTFRDLQRAGRVEELTDGAVYGADATFRTEGLPWCPEIF